MTKSQLIEAMRVRFPHLHKSDVTVAVNAVFEGLTEGLKRDGRVEIRGFGSFALRKHSAREGRNPKTGERVLVPTKRIPSFTAGKELKERINDHLVRTVSGGEAA